MTTITVYRFANGDLAGYMASGHALPRRAVTGQQKDMVCTAVSVLTVTGVNALCTELQLERLPVEQQDDGFLRCIIPDNLEGDARVKAQTVLRTIVIGLTSIQQIYPKYIRMEERDWRQADASDESSALRS